MAEFKYLSPNGLRHFIDKVIGKVSEISNIGDGTVVGAIKSIESDMITGKHVGNVKTLVHFSEEMSTNTETPKIDADLLGGVAAEGYATKEEVTEINNSLEQISKAEEITLDTDVTLTRVGNLRIVKLNGVSKATTNNVIASVSISDRPIKDTYSTCFLYSKSTRKLHCAYITAAKDGNITVQYYEPASIPSPGTSIDWKFFGEIVYTV